MDGTLGVFSRLLSDLYCLLVSKLKFLISLRLWGCNVQKCYCFYTLALGLSLSLSHKIHHWWWRQYPPLYHVYYVLCYLLITVFFLFSSFMCNLSIIVNVDRPQWSSEKIKVEMKLYLIDIFSIDMDMWSRPCPYDGLHIISKQTNNSHHCYLLILSCENLVNPVLLTVFSSYLNQQHHLVLIKPFLNINPKIHDQYTKIKAVCPKPLNVLKKLFYGDKRFSFEGMILF